MSKAGKVVKKAAKGVTDVVKKSIEISSNPGKYANPKHWFKDAMPDPEAAPLMPDYEEIEKARRRRTSSKFGRTETLMTTDLLG